MKRRKTTLKPTTKEIQDYLEREFKEELKNALIRSMMKKKKLN